jgi:hypothetical protein
MREWERATMMCRFGFASCRDCVEHSGYAFSEKAFVG